MKRVFLKTFPLLIAAIVGAALYEISLSMQPPLRDLFVGLSSAFIAVPLLFFGYQSFANYSAQRLKKNVLYFFRLRIDTSIISLINQLTKVVYSYEQREFSFKEINSFLELKERDIRNLVTNNVYLGFQLFKQWNDEEEKLTKVLTDGNAFSVLEENMVNALIEILKSIRAFSGYVRNKAIYELSEIENKSFSIAGTQPSNQYVPQRKLLLKRLKEGENVVYDFGDFIGLDEAELLLYYRIKRAEIDQFARLTFSFSSRLRKWASSSTG